MKKALSILLTALLLVALIPTAVLADPVKTAIPDEMDYPTWDPVENSGEGFPTNSDPTATDSEGDEAEAAAIAAAAASAGLTPLEGIYIFVDGIEGWNQQEGGGGMIDGKVRTKFGTGNLPYAVIYQLDGKYHIDGVLLATANDSASYDRNPLEWCIFGSNDGQEWTPIIYGDDSFFEMTNVTYYAGKAQQPGDYEIVMFFSDIGGLSGTQIGEMILTGSKVSDSTIEVEKGQIPVWGKAIDIEAGEPLSNNGAGYADEASAIASIGGGESISSHITNFFTQYDGRFTPGFDGEDHEKLYDGDTATKFCANQIPNVSTIELDDYYGITGIAMATANDNAEYNQRNPYDWAILGSNDLEHWTVIANGNENFFLQPDGETNLTYYAAAIEKTGGYKYFQFQNADSPSQVFQMSELVLVGEPAEAAVYEEPVVELPGFATADEAAASIGKAIISGYTYVEEGSTSGFGGESSDNLWDGDNTTKMCTNELPAISIAELDGFYSIDGVLIAMANDNDPYGRVPTAWTLSGSADGETWTEIISGTDADLAKVNERYFAIAAGAASDAVKFVKIEVASSTDEIMQISEVVVTGKSAAAPAEETVEETVTVAEPETTKTETTTTTAAQTFDFGLIALVAAIVSLAGFAFSKKH